MTLEFVSIGTPTVTVGIRPSLKMQCVKCGKKLFPEWEETKNYVNLEYRANSPRTQKVFFICQCRWEIGYPWSFIRLLGFIEELTNKEIYKTRLTVCTDDGPIVANIS